MKGFILFYFSSDHFIRIFFSKSCFSTILPNFLKQGSILILLSKVVNDCSQDDLHGYLGEKFTNTLATRYLIHHDNPTKAIGFLSIPLKVMYSQIYAFRLVWHEMCCTVPTSFEFFTPSEFLHKCGGSICKSKMQAFPYSWTRLYLKVHEWMVIHFFWNWINFTFA